MPNGWGQPLTQSCRLIMMGVDARGLYKVPVGSGKKNTTKGSCFLKTMKRKHS